jgi:glucose-6-phosphate 1-dehydrogenase
MSRMTLVAMESPSKYTAENLRNEKMKVLDCIPVPTPEQAGKIVAVGQYQGYRDELKKADLDPNSKTPTYAAVRLTVENSRWKNVPFYIRSGKGLKSRYSEVMIQFRCPPHLMFPLPPGEVLRCNHMTLVLQPNEGITLNFQTKVPDVDGTSLRPRDLSSGRGRSWTRSSPPPSRRVRRSRRVTTSGRRGRSVPTNCSPPRAASGSRSNNESRPCPANRPP